MLHATFSDVEEEEEEEEETAAAAAAAGGELASGRTAADLAYSLSNPS